MATKVGDPLPPSFYAGDALTVARGLIGKLVRHGPVIVRITETEAYRGPADSAAHARFGITARTRTLFGPVGHAYIYLCYGLHWMLNVVTTGDGSAVLIRAGEPVGGLSLIERRRGGQRGPGILAGPGKLGQGLGLAAAHDGVPLSGQGVITVHDAPPPAGLLIGPRVGIDYAEPRHVRAPWRFALAGTKAVSRPQTLRLEGSGRASGELTEPRRARRRSDEGH